MHRFKIHIPATFGSNARKGKKHLCSLHSMIDLAYRTFALHKQWINGHCFFSAPKDTNLPYATVFFSNPVSKTALLYFFFKKEDKVNKQNEKYYNTSALFLLPFDNWGIKRFLMNGCFVP